jgi:hypothetical protein
MVARPKQSKRLTRPKISETLRKVMESLKKPKTKRDPSAYLTGPGRKPKKLPKVSDLLYRPKRDKDGNIIKPRPKNPKLPKDRKPPRMIPMKSRKPKKK